MQRVLAVEADPTAGLGHFDSKTGALNRPPDSCEENANQRSLFSCPNTKLDCAHWSAYLADGTQLIWQLPLRL